MFRFAPGGGLAGVHGFELAPVGTDRTRITHFLDAEAAAWMRPLVPILIGWHDAMVETAFDRAEREATGSLARPSRIPRWLRIVNGIEIAIGRAFGSSRREASEPNTTPARDAASAPSFSQLRATHVRYARWRTGVTLRVLQRGS